MPPCKSSTPNSAELIIRAAILSDDRKSNWPEEAGVASSTIGHRLEKAVERLRIHLKTMGCIAANRWRSRRPDRSPSAPVRLAAVSPPLTANVMRIGLSGVPAAEGALLGGLLFKLFATAAAVLLIAAGIWFSIPHHQSPL